MKNQQRDIKEEVKQLRRKQREYKEQTFWFVWTKTRKYKPKSR